MAAVTEFLLKERVGQRQQLLVEVIIACVCCERGKDSPRPILAWKCLVNYGPETIASPREGIRGLGFITRTGQNVRAAIYLQGMCVHMTCSFFIYCCLLSLFESQLL